VEWTTVFTAMVGVHLLIGLGEGLISALVLAAVQRTRPELVSGTAPAAHPPRRGELLGYGLMVSLGLALFVAPLACPWPDGLEAVAEKLGFAHAASPPTLPAPAPDYVFPGIGSPAVATSLAGAVGAILVFLLALLLARTLVVERAAPDSAARRDP
jgi:cobalt/nickel transport system permease protein